MCTFSSAFKRTRFVALTVRRLPLQLLPLRLESSFCMASLVEAHVSLFHQDISRKSFFSTLIFVVCIPISGHIGVSSQTYKWLHPLLPYLFLYLSGAAFNRRQAEGIWLDEKNLPLVTMGRRSLLIYILHQPILLWPSSVRISLTPYGSKSIRCQLLACCSCKLAALVNRLNLKAPDGEIRIECPGFV